jgi:hypothetical protein
MIRTIQDETNAAAQLAMFIPPLTVGDAAGATLPLTAPSGAATGIDVTAGSGAVSLISQGEVVPGSVWPLLGIDTFIEFTNDTGTVAQASDFNTLVSAVRAIEAWTLRVARASPADLAARLNDSGGRNL